MKFETTFDDCMAKEACISGIKKARRHLGIEFPRDKPVPLASIVKVLGVSDTLWVLGHVLDAKDLLVEFAIWNAEQVLPVFEKEFPDDKRPREAIEAAKSGEGLGEAEGGARAAAEAVETAWAAWAVETAWAAWAAARAVETAGAAARAVETAGAAGAAEAVETAWAARAAGVTIEDQIRWLEEKLS